jgi:hypothetical protein
VGGGRGEGAGRQRQGRTAGGAMFWAEQAWQGKGLPLTRGVQRDADAQPLLAAPLHAVLNHRRGPAGAGKCKRMCAGEHDCSLRGTLKSASRACGNSAPQQQAIFMRAPHCRRPASPPTSPAQLAPEP